MKKTVCIVNYNTTELTRAAIRSIRKHGDEKVAILKAFNDQLPNSIKMMEHVTKQNARWGYTKLTADKGYLLRSKETGQTYQEITVPNPSCFEVIPVEPEKKESKPRTRKSK